MPTKKEWYREGDVCNFKHTEDSVSDLTALLDDFAAAGLRGHLGSVSAILRLALKYAANSDGAFVHFAITGEYGDGSEPGAVPEVSTTLARAGNGDLVRPVPALQILPRDDEAGNGPRHSDKPRRSFTRNGS